MSSRIEFTGKDGLTATTKGELVTCVMATKSRSVSYEMFLLTIGLMIMPLWLAIMMV